MKLNKDKYDTNIINIIVLRVFEAHIITSKIRTSYFIIYLVHISLYHDIIYIIFK